ncbi:hypothetical protein Btru_055468 [Bulinus truncatus]|nr:hypothetical protein Btru_055468 [Bulinus truncatus]
MSNSIIFFVALMIARTLVVSDRKLVVDLEVDNTGQGGVKSHVVVTGDLVHNVVRPCINVLVILFWASDKSSGQYVWVGRERISKCTRGGFAGTGGGPVVRPKGVLAAVADLVAVAATVVWVVTQDVVDLFHGPLPVLVNCNSGVSGHKSHECSNQ